MKQEAQSQWFEWANQPQSRFLIQGQAVKLALSEVSSEIIHQEMQAGWIQECLSF